MPELKHTQLCRSRDSDVQHVPAALTGSTWRVCSATLCQAWGGADTSSASCSAKPLTTTAPVRTEFSTTAEFTTRMAPSCEGLQPTGWPCPMLGAGGRDLCYTLWWESTNKTLRETKRGIAAVGHRRRTGGGTEKSAGYRLRYRGTRLDLKRPLDLGNRLLENLGHVLEELLLLLTRLALSRGSR